MNILFVVEVKNSILIEWSYRYPFIFFSVLIVNHLCSVTNIVCKPHIICHSL